MHSDSQACYSHTYNQYNFCKKMPTLSLANFSLVGDRTLPRMLFELASILSLTSLTEVGERSLLSTESELLTRGRESLSLRPEFCRDTFGVSTLLLLPSLSAVPSESAEPDLHAIKHVYFRNNVTAHRIPNSIWAHSLTNHRTAVYVTKCVYNSSALW
jgi:hypothetical protein